MEKKTRKLCAQIRVEIAPQKNSRFSCQASKAIRQKGHNFCLIAFLFQPEPTMPLCECEAGLAEACSAMK
jgi:hypothetical protein